MLYIIRLYSQLESAISSSNILFISSINIFVNLSYSAVILESKAILII